MPQPSSPSTIRAPSPSALVSTRNTPGVWASAAAASSPQPGAQTAFTCGPRINAEEHRRAGLAQPQHGSHGGDCGFVPIHERRTGGQHQSVHLQAAMLGDVGQRVVAPLQHGTLGGAEIFGCGARPSIEEGRRRTRRFHADRGRRALGSVRRNGHGHFKRPGILVQQRRCRPVRFRFQRHEAAEDRSRRGSRPPFAPTSIARRG